MIDPLTLCIGCGASALISYVTGAVLGYRAGRSSRELTVRRTPDDSTWREFCTFRSLGKEPQEPLFSAVRRQIDTAYANGYVDGTAARERKGAGTVWLSSS